MLARFQVQRRGFANTALLAVAPKTFNTISSYRQWRWSLPNSSSIGFVPTLGALHDGHISLIRSAARENDHVVVSIFLNPAQFAPTEDLASYPRTLARDLAMIEDMNREIALDSSVLGSVQAVFVPTTQEMYPLGIPLDTASQAGTFVTVTPLASRLEGVTRPHFFRGVATVCTKLFNVVQPTRAYFGQKDIQQTIVLRRLITDLHLPIVLRVCPTLREADGLAMSSRNVYLLDKRRRLATVLFKALTAAEGIYKAGVTDRESILGAALKTVDTFTEQGANIKLDYISLADGEMLEELERISTPGAVLSGAIFMLPTAEGEKAVRIIDNIILE